MKPRLNTRH